jgi:hypothetical protein
VTSCLNSRKCVKSGCDNDRLAMLHLRMDELESKIAAKRSAMRLTCMEATGVLSDLLNVALDYLFDASHVWTAERVWRFAATQPTRWSGHWMLVSNTTVVPGLKDVERSMIVSHNSWIRARNVVLGCCIGGSHASDCHLWMSSFVASSCRQCLNSYYASEFSTSGDPLVAATTALCSTCLHAVKL